MRILLTNILIINLLLIIIMVFCEHKNLKSIIFWCFIILTFSIIGFIAYVILGNRLKFKAKKQLLKKQKSTKNYIKYTYWYKNYLKNNSLFKNKINIKFTNIKCCVLKNKKITNKQKKLNLIKINQNKLCNYLQDNFNASLWHNNTIQIFTNGTSFFNNLLNDIKTAKHTINLEFYIFADDAFGNHLANALIQKAQSGVIVNVIYDAVGSRKTNKQFWQKMQSAGINVYPFFPSNFLNINFKINYRNHRKIVIIDGIVAYTGGINIQEDHMGNNKYLNPWRDTQIKIIGNASYALQDVFLNDLCFAGNLKITTKNIQKFFPPPNKQNGIALQIISSGPQNTKCEIKQTFIKIIELSNKFLYIQTPYFIVKKDIINKIQDAKNRGVDVKIIIPQKPDKKLVYAGSLYCLKKLLQSGIEVYLYKGFIHSKTVQSDSVLCIGSCNFDNRSLELNFETSALIYNKLLLKQHKKIFINDLKNSTKLTKKKHSKLCSKNIFFKLFYEIVYRLL